MGGRNEVRELITEFAQENIKYALIGGFALGLWGINRATADLDFLVDKSYREKLMRVMSNAGYKVFYESENVAQFEKIGGILNGIDVLYAFREVSLSMLNRAVEKEVFSGKLRVKVLKVEDLIGLKIQSLKNDPSRLIDWWDIESALKLYGRDIDWSRVKEYFYMFDFKAEYGKFENEYRK